MKNKLLLIATLFFVSTSYCQKGKEKEEVITYTTNDGTIYSVGDTIFLGMGTNPNGGFKYIFHVDSWHGNSYWSAGLNNKFAIIDKFKWGGNEKMGKTMYVAFRNAGDLSSINLESAISAGEVITPNSKKNLEEKSKPIIIQQSTLSLADELKKLKELLDAGILTQAEYDTQKQKLLNK